MIDEEDADLSPEDDWPLGNIVEEDEGGDEYGCFDYDISENKELSSTREDNDLRNERQEGEDTEADVNESLEKEHSLNPLDPDESQRSRKRSGSTLEGGLGKKSGKKR